MNLKKWLVLAFMALALPAIAADIASQSDTGAPNVTDASNTTRFAEGQAPSTVNNGARALEGMIARYAGDTGNGYVTTGGSSTAYTVTLSRATISAWYPGLQFTVKFHTASGSNPTVNPTPNGGSALGAKSLYWPNGTQVTTNDIPSGMIARLAYDGTNVQVMGLTGLSNPMTITGQMIHYYAGAVSFVNLSTNGVAPVGNGTNVVATGIRKQGKETIWIPAAAMISRTTSSSTISTAELSTNKVMVKALAFNKDADSFAQFTVGMPKSWNGGTITYQVYWTGSVGSGDVIWGLQGVSYSDGGALDASFGTAVTVTDTFQSANQLHIAAESSAVTIASAGAGKYTIFQVYRDADAGGDTLSGDAQLLGIRLFYTTSSPDDT